MIKLGLIGAGRWGRNYIRTITALDGLRLVRVASLNPETKRFVAPHTHIDSDWRALITAGDIDGVIVATPPLLHAQMARASIVAGLPVLVEKPLTLGLQEAVELRDFSRAHGGLVMVDHIHLFHPAFEELCRQLPRLGPLLRIEGCAGNHGPVRVDTSVLWDWGVHDVAMCLAVTGVPPIGAQALVEATQRIEGRVAQTVRLTLNFDNDLTADIKISNMMDKQRRFAVTGLRGTLVYDDLASQKLMFHPSESLGIPQKGTPIEVSEEPPLQRVLGAFSALIKERQIRSSDLDDAVEVIRVIHDCEQNSPSGEHA